MFIEAGRVSEVRRITGADAEEIWLIVQLVCLYEQDLLVAFLL